MYRLTALVFLFAVFGYGSCLNCYQCNTQADKTCGDPFSNKNYVNCDTPSTYNNQYLPFVSNISPALSTKKVCAKVILQNKNVVRTCLSAMVPNNIAATCEAVKNAAIQYQTPVSVQPRVEYCMVCDKDYCNGAASMVASPLAVLAVLAALYYKQ